MGYQIGLVCYDDKQSAEDAYYSEVVPHINDKGLFQPVRKSDGWYYQEVKLSASFPSCNPTEDFIYGMELAVLLIYPMMVAWSVNLIRRLLR